MDLQDMVDHIADAVRRPTLLEDRRQRAVVYSPQSEQIDEVRRTTILQRHATPDVRAWLQELGLPTARQPIRTPHNKNLGMLPRLCVPIWKAEVPLGYLWFIEAPDAMSDRDVEIVSDLGSDLADQWYQSRRDHDSTSSRLTSDVRDLILGSGQAMRTAATRLLNDGYLPGGSTVRVVTIQVVRSGLADLTEDIRPQLESMIDSTRRIVGVTRFLTFTQADHAVVLLSSPAGGTGLAIEQVAQGLSEAATRALANVPTVSRIVVGVGDTRGSLDQAQDSYLEACRAAQIAVSFRLDGAVAFWGKLGIYRGLYTIANNGVRADDLQTGLSQLMNEKDGDALLHTLECYLNLGGQVQGAAAQLNLHRTSLYYRLDRIQRITGADLQDGVQRLGLHLAVLLYRMDRAALHGS